MGACGCGNFQGEFKLPGPDGSWYVIERYYGCDYCNGAAGTRIYKFTGENIDLWDANHLPGFPFNLYPASLTDGEGFLPLIHGKHLMEKLKAEAGEEAILGLDENDFIRIIDSAVRETIREGRE